MYLRSLRTVIFCAGFPFNVMSIGEFSPAVGCNCKLFSVAHQVLKAEFNFIVAERIFDTKSMEL